MTPTYRSGLAPMVAVLVVALLAFCIGWMFGPKERTAASYVATAASQAPRAANGDDEVVERPAVFDFALPVLPALSTPRKPAAYDGLIRNAAFRHALSPERLPSLPPADTGTGTYRAMLRSAASRHALSADLVEAVAQVESDFDPRSVSSKGALGIMQLIPETAERFGVMRHELHDPERNIAAGTAYLAWLRDRYHGDLDRMLAAYNAGEGAVDKYDGIPPYRETQQYVQKVRAALRGGQ